LVSSVHSRYTSARTVLKTEYRRRLGRCWLDLVHCQLTALVVDLLEAIEAVACCRWVTGPLTLAALEDVRLSSLRDDAQRSRTSRLQAIIVGRLQIAEFMSNRSGVAIAGKYFAV